MEQWETLVSLCYEYSRYSLIELNNMLSNLLEQVDILNRKSSYIFDKINHYHHNYNTGLNPENEIKAKRLEIEYDNYCNIIIDLKTRISIVEYAISEINKQKQI